LLKSAYYECRSSEWLLQHYTCGGFRHIAYHYRNRGRGKAMEGRRVEYGEGRIKEIHN